MRRFVRSLVLFSLFAIGFYIVGLFLAPNFLKRNLNYKIGSYGHMYSRIHEIGTLKNTELLFLGSSHTYRGFDTRIFNSAGFCSFNLGSSNQTPMQTDLLIRKYLKQINPSTVIYEVNPTAFINDGVESSLDLIANDTLSKATMEMALDLNNIKTWNTLLYGWIRKGLGIDRNYKEDSIRLMDKYIQGGFVERKLEFNHTRTIKPEVYIPLDYQLKYFDATLKYLKDHNMDVILVQAPVTKAQYRTYLNSEQFDSLMNTKHLPYINMNKLMHLDDSLDFYDNHHLNQNGVLKFNNRMIDMLREMDKKKTNQVTE